MKKTLLLFSLMLCSSVLSGCDSRDDGPVTIKEINGEQFDKIYANTLFDIKLVKSDSYSIRVEIPARFESYTNVEIKEGRLELTNSYSGDSNDDDVVVAYVSTPYLEEVTLNGMSGLASSGTFSTEGDFKLDLSGMSTIGNFQITCSDMYLTAGGMSSVNMVLTCNNADMNIGGMSDVDADVEVSNFAEVAISGMSKATLRGNARIGRVNVTGMSSYSGSKFYGNIKVSSSGSSQ